MQSGEHTHVTRVCVCVEVRAGAGTRVLIKRVCKSENETEREGERERERASPLDNYASRWKHPCHKWFVCECLSVCVYVWERERENAKFVCTYFYPVYECKRNPFLLPTHTHTHTHRQTSRQTEAERQKERHAHARKCVCERDRQTKRETDER